MSAEFSVSKHVILQATPEQVWRAIATPDGQAAWSPDPEAASFEGMEVEVEEGRRLAVRTPAGPDGAFHAFEYLVEGQGEGVTSLRFVHSGYLGEDWEGEFDYGELTSRGWDMYLHTLSQYLEHFAGRPAVYVEAEGPASSASPEAWSVLERALGLDVAPALGETVRLTPRGLEPIDGVVDYVEPEDNFLALRTEDGLLRFHDRAVMGMPLAVGHYLYSGADPEALRRRWAAWLEDLFA